MAVIISERDFGDLGGMRTFWAYNAMDCMVTREVWDVLTPRLTPTTERTYKFEMGCQAPAYAMMLRGVAVDLATREEAIQTLVADYGVMAEECDGLVKEKWDGTETETGLCPENAGKRHKWPRGVADGPERRCAACGASRIKRQPFNPLSDDQGKHLLYTLLRVPTQTNKKGIPSVDKECLDRIARKFPRVQAVVLKIIECRRVWKQVSMLRTGVSADGRIRSSFNVGGAWTGRWSSSSSPFGEGGNLQNIPEKLRYIFRADPQKEIFYADLEQAESCCVAYLAGDEGYIAAHRDGDVHTTVCRLVFPDLPWTGDLAKDKVIASTTRPPWDPEHSYRDINKKIVHGANYLRTANGIAREAHIPQTAAREALDRYMDQFPMIRQWHYATVAEVKATSCLTSPVGRRCQFFGRLWDDHTFKQAVAFKPQSMVGDILNAALWRVWEELDPSLVWLYAQVHDAILGGYAVGDKETQDRMLELMTMPLDIKGLDGKVRTMRIAVDCKAGQNWAKQNLNPEKGRLNPGGLH